MADYSTSMPVRLDEGFVRIDTSKSLNTTRVFNNRLVLEPYTSDRALKTRNRNGFAMIEQKIAVEGLKVLIDSVLNDGTLIPKGSTAYLKEEFLHSDPRVQKVLESEAVEGPFIIVDLNFVEFIKP
jgi:hypothetical protein